MVLHFCRARWAGGATRDGAAAADGAAAPSLEVGNRVQQQHAQHGGWVGSGFRDRPLFCGDALLVTLSHPPSPSSPANLVLSDASDVPRVAIAGREAK